MKPTPVFLPGESHGQWTLVGYSPWGHKKSDMTEACIHFFWCDPDGRESACNAGDLGSILGLGWSSREENGNLLQYSCLENPIYSGAWQGDPRVTLNTWSHKESDTTESLSTHKHTSLCHYLVWPCVPRFPWKFSAPELELAIILREKVIKTALCVVRTLTGTRLAILFRPPQWTELRIYVDKRLDRW